MGLVLTPLGESCLVRLKHVAGVAPLASSGALLVFPALGFGLLVVFQHLLVLFVGGHVFFLLSLTFLGSKVFRPQVVRAFPECL